ncbi:MAG TPA: histone deacetylase [Nitrospirota bacterium]|nr:histone deacetylase [Nitrospirota bacterium]
MKKVGFAFDEVFLRHEPPVWHPDSPDRLINIIITLKAAGLWPRLILLSPRLATFDDIARVHTRGYIEKIKSFGSGELDPDTFLSEGSLDAALHAAGAVIEAVKQCRQGQIDRAFCAIRPPGHHAEADQGMGFCIFNNVAVAARYARYSGYRRVFIVDFDAHHGNGTQHIFEEDDSVFYFSTHQHPYYPDTGRDMERGKGRGLGFTYNVPIQAGSGNRDYLMVYQDILPGLIQRFDPDLVLVSAGYDIHVNDPHANIRVSNEGIHGIVRSILNSCTSCPAVFALEGGYDLPSLCDSVKLTIEEMLKE